MRMVDKLQDNKKSLQEISKLRDSTATELHQLQVAEREVREDLQKQQAAVQEARVTAQEARVTAHVLHAEVERNRKALERAESDRLDAAEKTKASLKEAEAELALAMQRLEEVKKSPQQVAKPEEPPSAYQKAKASLAQWLLK